MLRLGIVLVLAGAALAEEHRSERWRFVFKNGDRVHGRLHRIRTGSVLVRIGAGERTVVIAIDRIKTAERAPLEDGATETRPPRETSEILRMRDGTVLLGRFLGIKDGTIDFRVATIGTVRVAGDQVSEYLPTEEAVRSYYRMISPSRSSEGEMLSASAFQALWSSLARRDANAAWRARRALLEAGVHALPWMRARLRWQPDAPKRLRLLIAYLDDDDAGVRRLVQRKLLELASISEPYLREALGGNLPVEARARATAVLTRIAARADPKEPPEILRMVRAIGVLEEMGTPEAKEILVELAAGSPRARTTREARLALERLKIDRD